MIENKERFDDFTELTQEKIQSALNEAIDRVKKHMHEFKDGFPPPASVNNVYPCTENRDWTEGFYTGILWLCYEATGDNSFRELAEHQLESFKNRIENKIETNHHDMGFLYSLSCVAAYKLTGNESARHSALLAADNLLSRFQEKGQFLQAWGAMGAESNYRLIIDCLLNLPLLYWATETTGDGKYADIARRHLETTMKVIVRDDDSTHHTYYFNKETGEPLYGKTSQGYSDDSAWARGQSWGVYGLMLNYIYTKKEDIPPLWYRVTDYYLNNIPKDKVAYWDLIFKDGDQPRDSSSSVITVCGILEAYKQGVCDESYVKAAKSILNAVIDMCSTKDTPESNGLLLHSTYTITNGADECNIWGDYFYMEALTRLTKDWKLYW